MTQNSGMYNTQQSVPQTADPEKIKLEKGVKSGASWFFWIVGLSLINTIIIIIGGDWRFLIGLGLTEFAAGVAYGLGMSAIGPIIAFIIIGGIFGTLGYFALKRYTWAFVVGMVLYFLDGLIFLLVADWLSIAFHIFVLICLGFGLRANLRYKKYMAQKNLYYSISAK